MKKTKVFFLCKRTKIQITEYISLVKQKGITAYMSILETILV